MIKLDFTQLRFTLTAVLGQSLRLIFVVLGILALGALTLACATKLAVQTSAEIVDSKDATGLRGDDRVAKESSINAPQKASL
jgi:hypothetical protein